MLALRFATVFLYFLGYCCIAAQLIQGQEPLEGYIVVCGAAGLHTIEQAICLGFAQILKQLRQKMSFCAKQFASSLKRLNTRRQMRIKANRNTRAGP